MIYSKACGEFTLTKLIFNGESISYKVFCEKYHQVTGRSLTSAHRDMKMMKQLELVVKEGRKWKLNS